MCLVATGALSGTVPFVIRCTGVGGVGLEKYMNQIGLAFSSRKTKAFALWLSAQKSTSDETDRREIERQRERERDADADGRADKPSCYWL